MGIPDAASANAHADSGDSVSRQVARRLLGREGIPGDGEQRGVGDALQRMCARMCCNLRDTMGDDGCTALLARALARTEAAHPALMSIRRISRGTISLDRVVDGVEAHGVAAVTAGIEALLIALIEILGRLIGEDMAIRILELGEPRPARSNPASSP